MLIAKPAQDLQQTNAQVAPVPKKQSKQGHAYVTQQATISTWLAAPQLAKLDAPIATP